MELPAALAREAKMLAARLYLQYILLTTRLSSRRSQVSKAVVPSSSRWHRCRRSRRSDRRHHACRGRGVNRETGPGIPAETPHERHPAAVVRRYQDPEWSAQGRPVAGIVGRPPRTHLSRRITSCLKKA